MLTATTENSARCANCNNLLGNSPETSATIPIKDDLVSEVRVCHAIAYIYGISAQHFQDVLSSYSKTTADCVAQDWPEVGKISLCDSCVPMLTENYRTHKHFESATHPTSLIQRVKSFRDERCENQTPSMEIKEQCSKRKDMSENESNLEYNLLEETAFVDEEGFSEAVEEIEEKYEVREESGEVSNDSVEEKPNLITFPPKMKDSFVKLEKLSSDDLKLKYGIDVKAETTDETNGRNTEFRKSIGRNIKKAKRKTRRRRRKDYIGLTKQLNIPCEICKKVYTNMKYFRRHEKRRHSGGREIISCELCGKVFLLKNSILRHNCPRKKVPCDLCGQMYSNKNCLYSHKKLQHSVREPYKCDTCGKAFFSKQHYGEHMETHSATFTPYLCGTCGKTFDSKKRLLEHEKIHSGKNISCEICSKKFTTKALLRVHKRTHETERKFVCEECGKSYRVKTMLDNHRKLHQEITANGEYAAKCEECGKLFIHSSSLYAHTLRSHRGAPKQIHECTVCGKTLSSASNLKVHERIHEKNPGAQPRKKALKDKSIDNNLD